MATDLAEILDAVHMLKDIKADVITNNNDLNEELDRFNAQFTQLTEINGQLRQHLEESNKKISHLKQKMCNLENEIHRKEKEEKEMRKLYHEYNEMKACIVNLKSKREMNAEQIKKMEKEYEELQVCPQEKVVKIIEYENITEKLQQKFSVYKGAIVNLKADNSSLQKAIEECNDHVQEKSEEISMLSQKMENIEKEKQKLVGQLKDLQNNRKEMDEKCKVQQTKKEKLNEGIKYFQEANFQLRKEGKTLEESVRDLNRTCNARLKHLDKKRKALNKLCEEYEFDKKRIFRIRKKLSSSCLAAAKPVILSSHSGFGSRSRQYRNRTIGGSGDRRSFNSRSEVTKYSSVTRNNRDFFESSEMSSRTSGSYKNDNLSTSKFRSQFKDVRLLDIDSSSQIFEAHSSKTSRPKVVTQTSLSSRPKVVTHSSRPSRPKVVAHSSNQSPVNMDSCRSSGPKVSARPEVLVSRRQNTPNKDRLKCMFKKLRKLI